MSPPSAKFPLLNKYQACKLAVLFVVALFLVVLFRGVSIDFRDGSSYSDTFEFGLQAKHMARGDGWFNFDFETGDHSESWITVGPTILLPAALSIHFFGNTLSAITKTTFALNLGLFLLILILLMRESDEWIHVWRIASFLLLTLITLRRFAWAEMIGEGAALFFLIIGILLFLRESTSRENNIGLIFLGLSGLTKSFCWISVFCGFALCLFFKKTETTTKEKLFRFIKMILLIIAPSLLWNIIEITHLKKSDVPIYMNALIKFYEESSGISKNLLADNGLSQILSNITNNFSALRTYYSNLAGAAIFLFFPLIFCLAGFRKKKNFLERLSLVLFLAGLAQVMFWVFFDPFHWIRRVIPGLFLCSTPISLALSKDLHSHKNKFILILNFLYLIYLCPNLKDWTYPQGLYPNRSQELTETVQFLNEIKKPNVDLWGSYWFYNQDVDYAMPGSLNFRRCKNDQVTFHAEQNYWVRSNFSDDMVLGTKGMCLEIQSKCEKRIVFRNDYFTVSECPK